MLVKLKSVSNFTKPYQTSNAIYFYFKSHTTSDKTRGQKNTKL